MLRDFISFPPCFVFPHLVHQDTPAFLLQLRCYNRSLCSTSSGSFRKSFQLPYFLRCFESHSIRLAQSRSANLARPVQQTIWLKADPLKAAERAHYFMSSAPSQDTAPEQIHIKKYMICKIGFTSIGYMRLMENGTLQKGDGYNAFRNGYYRWRGPLYRRMRGR